MSMELDTATADPATLNRIAHTAIAPRPIGWISSRSPDGVDNLAPFSSFNYVCPSPIVIMLSSGRGDEGERKDTPRNAVETGEFVFNLVTEPLLEAMDATSKRLEPDESEFEFAGLERAESQRVTPPRVAEAAVSFECTLYDSLDIHHRELVFGEVEYIHVDDDLLTNGKIDARKVDLVARLGGPYYTGVDMLEVEKGY
jgi:flavin reductase (DIM6/NTAB) family NADH-FMN oxidoreductase RutF